TSAASSTAPLRSLAMAPSAASSAAVRTRVPTGVASASQAATTSAPAASDSRLPRLTGRGRGGGSPDGRRRGSGAGMSGARSRVMHLALRRRSPRAMLGGVGAHHAYRPRRTARLVAAAVVAAATACAWGGGGPEGGPEAPPPGIGVASFDFAESRLVAEIYAQALEEQGLAVRREIGLGPRELVHPALRQGFVDVVPEYLGSALRSAEAAPAAEPADPGEVRAALAAAVEPLGLAALEPAPAQNQNGLAVTRRTAARRDLATTS